MSSTFARLAAFVALLVAVFAGAALLGSAIGPSPSVADERDTHGDGEAMHGAAGGAAEHGASHGTLDANAAPPGLQVAQDGYRLVLARNRYAPGDRTPVRFRILDAHGEAVTRFDVAHEKRLHLIVVRRDLSGFQHLHPAMADDGTWSADVDLSRPGTWRVFADFTRDGVQRTLGADVQVPGSFRPAPPLTSGGGANTSARSDGGLDVALRSLPPRAGAEQRLEFEVRDGERVVTDRLQPYLGARGHLVALREGDLAYLHTHPSGDALSFATTWPSAGAYRLYLQFRYEDRVHTVTFDRQVPR